MSNGSLNTTAIIEALHWRYAVKRFDPNKKISEGDWHALTESLRLTPSSYGMEPWRFLVIQKPELREKLKAVSWKQSQVTDASHFVVFVTKEVVTESDVDGYLERVVKARGSTLESLEGLKTMLMKNLVAGMTPDESLHWSQRQSYIAMGFLMETAALMKIDTTPMEGLDPREYDRILGIEGSGWRTVAAVALGYRSVEDKYQTAKKVRCTSDEIIEYR